MLNNFIKRIISAVILIPIFIYILYNHPSLFQFASIMVTIIMASEWIMIINNKSTKPFSTNWFKFGLIILSFPSFFIIQASNNLENAANIIMEMFLIAWSSDIGGYVIGKTLKGPKLASEISPNKTWSGFMGGILFTIIILYCYYEKFLNIQLEYNYSFLIKFSFLSIISQLSDLLVSKLKRKYKVKDSGNLIPGHGGLLDRLDAILLLSLCYYIMFFCL